MRKSMMVLLALVGIQAAYAAELGKIIKLEVDKEIIAYKESQKMDEVGRFPVAKVTLPLNIIQSSDARLKVAIDGQEVWLDRNDVVSDAKVEVPGDCEPRRLTSATSAATRGLGEPCKSDPPSPKSQLATPNVKPVPANNNKSAKDKKKK